MTFLGCLSNSNDFPPLSYKYLKITVKFIRICPFLLKIKLLSPERYLSFKFHSDFCDNISFFVSQNRNEFLDSSMSELDVSHIHLWNA